MALRTATHNGPFHADDVLAFALLRTFVDDQATVVRTRDLAVLDQAEVVFDVGGRFAPEDGRFDHHQASYTGPLSSAGMVLDWLESAGHVAPALAVLLRARLVNWVDDVDNGRVAPTAGVPDFTTLVDTYNRGCQGLPDFDAQFVQAAAMAAQVLRGLVAEQAELDEAAGEVARAVTEAEARGSNVMVLGRYVRWKEPYFAQVGTTHPTEFVILPGTDGSWRVLGIPPEPGSFAQKVPLPAAWAGLVDGALVAVCGVEGARFCHKNRFIAVFDTQAHVWEALAGADLVRGTVPTLG